MLEHFHSFGRKPPLQKRNVLSGGGSSTQETDFDGFDVVEVPALTWAIFSSTGAFPTIMQETWGKIVSEWLPSSDYELVEAPEISFTGDLSDSNNVYSEIWIAVQEKG
ncbi:GyrI-like domain-containing protein [Sporosarcina sp. ACRSM]|uniref:GyrI-like domain-containing protein n=1 Tax=Sporosarcina sp. ACRSM TaxID=2918216 RepID=UPI001EF478E5|nr:GyrI-like domain-containing protein [Sporosarcina sp. ACRSM]